MRSIDLNADLGEGFAGIAPAEDAALFMLISSANVACGYHAGDAVLMQRTVATARTHGVQVGAHPGYPDPTGFGRRAVAATPDEVSAYITHQVGALSAFCRAAGATMRYVKPHGALYNTAMRDAAVATAIAQAVSALDASLMILALPESALARAATEHGLRAVREGFCDRGYREDGTLIPRGQPGALITDPEQAAAHALALAPHVDSLCVHSDTPGAIQIMRTVRARLEGEGWTIAAFAS
jgi:5-oxoprolinase (ATP-hydrolysing) subunit A